MEKLQAALEKARLERGTPEVRAEAVRPGKTRARSIRTESSSGPNAAWAALEPFDVPASVLENHRVVTRTAGPAAAPFDILRTKVLLQMRQNGWKRLAITSPMPQSGKTTTACNLALGLGRQREIRSILFDLDLRAPAMATYFGARVPHCVSDVLTGKVDFSDQAMRMGDNVALSMAQRAHADPARVLLAPETVSVLEGIEARYEPDIVIFDLPSMLVNDDTRAFLKNVDCALIVIRANETRYSQFDVCEREISEQTNVLGVMLNASRVHGSSFE